MKVLVTGSAGHLGEALVRVLGQQASLQVVGVDIKASPFTSVVGSIADPQVVQQCMQGVDVVYHTATLHKPHVATHSKQQFVQTNISGTLELLEAAVRHGVQRFVFTSTTSVFGDALRPAEHEPAAWITEAVRPIPKNIYGVTKTAAEDLCQLFHRNHGLNCVVLRTSRFFPEADDDRERREGFDDANLKALEFLYRRVDIEDVVDAHLKAADRAPQLGFDRFIISATSPFETEDLPQLHHSPLAVLRRRVPGIETALAELGWKSLPRIDRVYVNEAARSRLGWAPRHDFGAVLSRCREGGSVLSELAHTIGAKGYHEESFADGPYPVN